MALYGPALLTKAKLRHLAPSQRGALLTCWALACTTTPEACWPNRAALLEQLELDGFSESDCNALFAERWLESDDEGRVWIHDWDDHQLAATKEAARQWEATRKRSWRHKKSVETPSPVPPTPETRQDMTSHNKGPGHVPDTSRTDGASSLKTGTGWGAFNAKWAPFREAWTRYGLRLPPTEKQREKLWPIVDGFPSKVADWIDGAPRKHDAYQLVDYIFRRHSAVLELVPPDEFPTRQVDDGSAGERLNETVASRA